MIFELLLKLFNELYMSFKTIKYYYVQPFNTYA